MISKIVLGGGCFWCLEAAYQEVKGIKSITPGYAGGTTKDPSYSQVCSGTTGHAEVVELEFDDTIINLAQVLQVFFTIHDPTTINRQGNDVGSQYRSLILYSTDSQLGIIEQSLKQAEELWGSPPVTEVSQLAAFYPAEDEHINYYKNNPRAMYCQVVINPKLTKLRQQLASLTA